MLIVSLDFYQHNEAASQILRIITTVADNLPRFEVYQKLQTEPLLQASLLNIFSEIVEFSVLASRYFSRNTVLRLLRQVQCPFEREFGEILQRLDRHSKVVDKTAVAVEMLKAFEYRKRQEHAAQAALKLQIESWMKAANMRVVHEAQVKTSFMALVNGYGTTMCSRSGQICHHRLLPIGF
jgi:hypothetical protein